MEKSFNLSKSGKHLWTRELAAKIRVELNRLLDSSRSGEVVVIDAKDVEVFDYSFANELFGKALRSLQSEYTDRFLAVEHLTEYTRENLSKALESLNLMMVERRGSKLNLLGKVHPSDEETYLEIVQAKKPVSAVELKDALDLNINATNERLTKLTNLSVIRRTQGVSESGRKQFLYTAVK